jgi:hypothetical protein
MAGPGFTVFLRLCRVVRFRGFSDFHPGELSDSRQVFSPGPGCGRAQTWLIAGIAVNVGLLAYLKYFNFALSALDGLIGDASGLKREPISRDWDRWAKYLYTYNYIPPISKD